jgi:MFS transporter, DHA2 family, multidrug resistance protein
MVAPVNKWAVAVAVALGAMLEVIDVSIVNVALADIQASLGATLSEVSWVVSSYAIANVIILPLAAWLGQRYGKKRYFIFSLVGFVAASVLCGVAQSFTTLVIARVLQGLAGGGLLAKAQAILFETFPREEQAIAQGFFGIIVIAGPALGPTLGGYLVTNVDWRWIFFINVPVGIAAVMMCMAALPEDVEQKVVSGVDWLSILLLAAGLGSLQTVLEEGLAEYWFESAYIVTLSCVSAVSLVWFVLRQLDAAVPVVDLRVLRHRSLWVGSILSVVIGMVLYGALFAIPLFTQSILHYTAQETGLLLMPGALVSAFSMPLAARVVGKVDSRLVLVFGALTLSTALWQLSALSPQTGVDDLQWPLMIRGFGTVFMFLPLNMATLGPIPRNEIAAATGFFSLTRQLGGSVGVALLSTLISDRIAYHRAVLVEHTTVANPIMAERLQALTHFFAQKGASLEQARTSALTMIDGMVNQQAAVLSFADTFYATMALVAVSLPLILLLGKPTGSGPVSVGH